MMKIIDFYLKNSSIQFNLYKYVHKRNLVKNLNYIISHSSFFTKYLLCNTAILDNEWIVIYIIGLVSG